MKKILFAVVMVVLLQPVAAFAAIQNLTFDVEGMG